MSTPTPNLPAPNTDRQKPTADRRPPNADRRPPNADCRPPTAHVPLSPRQRLALSKLLEGATQRAAAAHAGVTTRTVRRWQRSEAFRAAHLQARAARWAAFTARRRAALLGEARARLIEISAAAGEGASVRAAERLLGGVGRPSRPASPGGGEFFGKRVIVGQKPTFLRRNRGGSRRRSGSASGCPGAGVLKNWDIAGQKRTFAALRERQPGSSTHVEHALGEAADP